MRAQYPNGAWPQRYRTFPDPEAYPIQPASFPESWPREWSDAPFHSHYTLNDECTLNLIDVFLEAHRLYGDPSYLKAALRGGDFLLFKNAVAHIECFEHGLFRVVRYRQVAGDQIGERTGFLNVVENRGRVTRLIWKHRGEPPRSFAKVHRQRVDLDIAVRGQTA